MIIFPAIDLMGGKCVRLLQGRVDTEIVYSHNPVEIARKWEAEGAQYLHVVDLDAALESRRDNVTSACEIASAVSIPVQLGGGVRDEVKIQRLLDSGIARVIVGTRACEREFLKGVLARFSDKIVVGIDARDGFVAVRGWVEVTRLKAVDFAREVEAMGASTIVFTDISTDGMLKGPNVAATAELLRNVDIDVIASGGISSVDDIEQLKRLESEGLVGAIVGKALYSGTIELKEAIEAARSTD